MAAMVTILMALRLLPLWVLAANAQISAWIEAGMGDLGAKEREFQQPPYEYSGDASRFTFVVVGAGVAGCVMAERLTEDAAAGWSVLLLEAGEDGTYAMGIPAFNGQTPGTNWNYTMAPQPSGGCPAGPAANCSYLRGLGMSGSSLINLAFWIRGPSDGYDGWAADGNVGWDYLSLLPYFRKVEKVQLPGQVDSSQRGENGRVTIQHAYEFPLTNLTLAAARALGVDDVDGDYNAGTLSGVHRLQASTADGRRVAACEAYVRGSRRPNLRVRKSARVTKVLIEDGVAVGVEYTWRGETRCAYADKEVILSAGAINSPQLLMLSGIGPKEHLESLGIEVVEDLPVGQSLQDHAAFVALPFTTDEKLYPTRSESLSNITTAAEYFVKQSGDWRGLRSTSSVAFFECGAAVNKSSAKVEVYTFQQSGILDAGAYGLPDEVRRRYVDPLSKLHSFQAFPYVMTPSSQGSVTLRSAYPDDQPVIDPAFFSDDEDLDVMVCGIKETVRLFTSGPFEALGARVYNVSFPGCEHLAFASDAYWRCVVPKATTDVFHPCCTCRMGPDGDPKAVVDNELLVRNVGNLRVVDASVMYKIPAAHLQAPTYAIAEKAADMIKCKHLGGSDCATTNWSEENGDD